MQNEILFLSQSAQPGGKRVHLQADSWRLNQPRPCPRNADA